MYCYIDSNDITLVAENIEYIVPFIDPRKRILKDVRADQFTQADYDAINEYIGKRGATVLASCS